MHGTADTICQIQGSDDFFAASTSLDKVYLKVPDGKHELLNSVAWKDRLKDIFAWMNTKVDDYTKLIAQSKGFLATSVRGD